MSTLWTVAEVLAATGGRAVNIPDGELTAISIASRAFARSGEGRRGFDDYLRVLATRRLADHGELGRTGPHRSGRPGTNVRNSRPEAAHRGQRRSGAHRGGAVRRALGPALHASLKDAVLANGATRIFLVGPVMENLAESIGKTRVAGHANDINEIQDAILASLAYGDAVMVKGSKGVRLAGLVKAIREKFA